LSDFAGNWNEQLAPDDKSTARSGTGYLIKYAGMPIKWASRLQTEVAQSFTESEYISLSTALCDAIPMIDFLCKMVTVGFKFVTTGSVLKCKAFEDTRDGSVP
jgi:hypothetical protein